MSILDDIREQMYEYERKGLKPVKVELPPKLCDELHDECAASIRYSEMTDPLMQVMGLVIESNPERSGVTVITERQVRRRGPFL